MATKTDSHPGGLKANAIDLFGDWVAGVATVAPSSSVAFTLALMLSFAGLTSPLDVLVVGIGMLFVAVGYARLNRWRPNAGAPFVWVGAVIRPWLGFAVGIMAVVGPLLANVGNITLAGSYLITVISPTYTPSALLVWIASAVVMAVVLYLAIRGIRPTIYVQIGMLVLEYAIIVLTVILSLIWETSGHHPGTMAPSFAMFSPRYSPTGWSGLLAAVVPIAFLYLGWESTLILGEETTDSHHNPGRAAILGTAFLVVWYTLLTMVFEGLASPKVLIAHGANVLAYAGSLLFPGAWDRLLPIAVFVAVFGTTQLQLVEGSRVLFAMARDRLMPKVFQSLSRHQTPLAAGWLLGVIPALALIPYLVNTAANTAIGDVISATGVLYLFVYALIAFTSVWFYRRHLTDTLSSFLVSGVMPIVGGLMMAGAFVYALFTQGAAIAWVGGGIVGVSLVLGGIVASRSRHEYFLQAPIVYGDDGTLSPGAESRSL
jgi:amino acid transporter